MKKKTTDDTLEETKPTEEEMEAEVFDKFVQLPVKVRRRVLKTMQTYELIMSIVKIVRKPNKQSMI